MERWASEIVVALVAFASGILIGRFSVDQVSASMFLLALTGIAMISGWVVYRASKP